MSEAREQMLRTIRAANHTVPLTLEDDYAAVPRGYVSLGSLTHADRLALFRERLHDYDATLHHTTEPDIARTVAQILSAREKRRFVVPRGLPQQWLPDDFDFIQDRELSYRELDEADGVITACSAAIALTGTIILQDASNQGRRALSLIPDYHLCVVRAAQIVDTVPEAIRFLSATRQLATTTISGPSATSDIEMTRIKGVHGPRVLEVVVVS